MLHSASETGWTDRRENLTSAMRARRRSALICARLTGVGSFRTAATSTAGPGGRGGVGRVRMRLRDHLDDADDRALLARVVEERLLALLHGAQVVPRREVADARPLRAFPPFRALLVPRPIVGLGLHEPICHRGASSIPCLE